MRQLSTLSDHDLVHLLQSGDEHVFTEIYHRYWEKLLAIGYYFLHDKTAAEDIVHDVMLSLWERKQVVPIHSLNAFLATAVKFSVFKAIARNKKYRKILANQKVLKPLSDIEEKLDAKFMQEYLAGSIETLPDKARLVFHFSRNENLSISEIGTKMKLTPKAVEYHLTKALKALRERMQKIKSLFI